ncbi:pyridoxamine 5'-phosphate oxidase family protein [Nocardioides sp. LHG3406-4]|uniref:pyridoxamine 5'-phosphate oxidase family protein n=1 Tax=Nocardioides sp. LHG3406-4 TaxID=2804575 RepID=UPI003CE9C254
MTNVDLARSILDDSSYVVLATADATGMPWASPVWFAQEDYRELFWVSFPGARHSQNIAARPQIGMVVFDSTATPGAGQAVYMRADCEQVQDPTSLASGMAVFSRKAERQGMPAWGTERVSGEARLRLYRARVREHSILDPDSPYDERVDVRP